jgi:Aerobic-type carbon monoxide dehydrogenase, large subunit CoxL/CutL homologs
MTPTTITNRSHRRVRTAALIAALVPIGAACGTDDDASAVTDAEVPTDVEHWCAVLADIDAAFTDGGINSDDFATARAAAEDIRVLFTQLREGIDVVDATARDAVAVEIGYGLDFTTAYADADDFAGAIKPLQQLAPGDGAQGAAGRAWILDHCGVDVSD